MARHECREVEKLAGLADIMLRTGCFCNPGACQAYLGLSHEDVISNYEAGHVCWDDRDIINGCPTGKAAAVSKALVTRFLTCQAHVLTRMRLEIFFGEFGCADIFMQQASAGLACRQTLNAHDCTLRACMCMCRCCAGLFWLYVYLVRCAGHSQVRLSLLPKRRSRASPLHLLRCSEQTSAVLAGCWYDRCATQRGFPVLCSFVEQYFVEEGPLRQQADHVLANGAAEDIPHGGVPHQLRAEAALCSTEDGKAEAARSGSSLGSQARITLSTGQSGSDADEAVLDQSHHSHVSDDEASVRTSSSVGAPLPAASSAADKAAVSGPCLAVEVQAEGPVTLESIWVYPIKSCAGFAPRSWPLGPNGFLYDRCIPYSSQCCLPHLIAPRSHWEQQEVAICCKLMAFATL